MRSSLDNFSVYDELRIQGDEKLTVLLEPDEKILFSSNLPKINKYDTSQDRFLIITSRNIYNIHPHDDFFTKLAFKLIPQTAVKRKIPIEKVWGITVTSQPSSQEFLIHVKEEYDYRYSAENKLEIILNCICSAYLAQCGKPFPLYVVDDYDISTFQTHDDDLFSGIDKKPTEGKIDLTLDNLEKGVEWLRENRKNLTEEARSIGHRNQDPNAMGYRNPGIPIEMNPEGGDVDLLRPENWEEEDM